MRSIIVGTAGHIDHGKSALVLALTGTDPDRLKEEKARGITIDLGFAHWADGDLNFAFVDVPGHEKFVRNMLAGVGGIDCVLLIVAADESVMPQTREHFQICRLLDVPAGIVVLTKSDLVDAEMLDLVRLEVRELVGGSFLESAPVVAVSSVTGAGLDDLRRELVAIAGGLDARPTSGVPRLPIDRVFSMKGFGTVVTGTLVAGQIRADEELVVLPSGTTVKVRGVQVHGRKQPQAEAGQRVALNLGGVEVTDLARGDTLTRPDDLPVTRLVDATIELLVDAKPLRHGARVRFHQGTAEIMGRVGVSAIAGGDEAAGEIPPGRRAFIRLRLEGAAVVTRGDRFILRAYSPPVTIAGGRVLDPTPPRSGLRTAAGRARFERLNAPSDLALAWMVEEAGTAGLPLSHVTSRANVAPNAVKATLDRLVSAKRATIAGGLVVAPAALDALKQQLLTTLHAHHQTDALSEGVPREEARVRLFGHAGPGVFEHVLEALVAAQKIEVRDKIALKGHAVSFTADEQRAQSAIEEAYRRAGLKPLDQASLGGQLGLASDVADRMLKVLLRQKTLTRVDTLVFHQAALRQLKDDVASLKNAGAGPATIDVGTFKERYGITRKFAIPLLEYLDRERVTRRVGDVRQVL